MLLIGVSDGVRYRSHPELRRHYSQPMSVLGKLAATFCDLQEDRAVRVAALESSRESARLMYPDLADPNQQQMRAYRELPDEELFAFAWVRVRLDEQDRPGFKASRAVCGVCGEQVSFRREIEREGRTLCRACAGERYWEPL